MQGEPLLWQARGPGFESPMLHQRLNWELALDSRECQDFCPWTTILSTCLMTTCSIGAYAQGVGIAISVAVQVPANGAGSTTRSFSGPSRTVSAFGQRA